MLFKTDVDEEPVSFTNGPEINRDKRISNLLSFLVGKDLTFRWKAAEALGAMRAVQAVEPLIKALDDPYVDVGWMAARALGQIGDLRAVEPLIARLSHEDQWMRKGAAWGLGLIGDKRAVMPLLPLLKDPKTKVKAQAAHALGKIGDERALLALHEVQGDETISSFVTQAIEMIEQKQKEASQKTSPEEDSEQNSKE